MLAATVILWVSSPRARGCFDADDELTKDALGLPRVRGGVSICPMRIMVLSGSSPRARGCFFAWSLLRLSHGVFPACAGVFPSMRK